MQGSSGGPLRLCKHLISPPSYVMMPYRASFSSASPWSNPVVLPEGLLSVDFCMLYVGAQLRLNRGNTGAGGAGGGLLQNGALHQPPPLVCVATAGGHAMNVHGGEEALRRRQEPRDALGQVPLP